MPVPYILLRGLVGLFCVFFAHFFGRSVARRLRSQAKNSQVFAWGLRTTVTALAVLWRVGFDVLSIIVFALAALSAGIGFYGERQPKKEEEDLSQAMFPKE